MEIKFFPRTTIRAKAGSQPSRDMSRPLAKFSKVAMLFVWGLLFFLITPHAAQAAGIADDDIVSGFSPTINVGGVISATVVQPDGKMVIAGSFTHVNSQPRGNIARLNTDGSLDESFSITTSVTGPINTLALQGDGKIVLGGEFTEINSVPRTELARLTPSGLLDASFNPVLDGSKVVVHSVIVQGDGKIVAGGYFSDSNSSEVNSLVRLNPDGTNDTDFLSETSPGVEGGAATVYALALGGDGEILVGGLFTSIANESIINFASLEKNGDPYEFDVDEVNSGAVYSIDFDWYNDTIAIGGAFTDHVVSVSFFDEDDVVSASGITAGVRVVKAQTDGKILYGGAGTPPSAVLGRVEVDGDNDASFSTIITGTTSPIVSDLAFWEDGSLLVVGRFSRAEYGTHESLALYDGGIEDTEGVVDPRFDPTLPDPPIAFDTFSYGVNEWAGLVSGDFDDDPNSYSVLSIDNDGPTGFDYTTNSPVTSIRATWDDRVILAGDFTNPHTRLVEVVFPDGEEPEVTQFPAVDGAIYDIDLSWDGKLVIGGFFQNVDATGRKYVAIFNPDRTLNSTFNPSPGPANNQPVDQVLFLPDGRVLIAADLLSGSSNPSNQLKLMTTTGAWDNTSGGFNDNVPTFSGGDINQLILDPDNSSAGYGFIAVGDFTSPRNYIVRLNANGTVDNSFDPNVNDEIVDIVRQSDGHFIIAGDFTQVNSTEVPQIVRLDDDGDIDSTFQPGDGPIDGDPRFLTLHNDETVFVGGYFEEFDVREVNGLAKLVRFFDPAFTNSTTPSASVYGQRVDVRTVLSGQLEGLDGPTGTVTFTSGSQLGTATLNYGPVTSTGTISTQAIPNIGSNTISIAYGGSRTYNPGSTSLAHSVSQASTNITYTISPNPAEYGDQVVIKAYANVVTPGSGTPSGMIDFTYGVTEPAKFASAPLVDGVATYTLPTFSILAPNPAITVTEFAVGSHDLGARYDGDTYFSGDEAERQLLTVNRVEVTVTLYTDANSKLLGETSQFAALVTGTTTIPTGNITFKDGDTVLGQMALQAYESSDNSAVAYATQQLALGSHSVTAEYSGDANHFSGASGSGTVIVAQEATTTTLTATPNPAANGSTISLEATVTSANPQINEPVEEPTGNVVFKDGTTVLQTVAVVDGVATFDTSSLALGEHLITAQYVGDEKFAGSTSEILSVNVVQYNSATALNVSPNPATAGQAVDFTATVTSDDGTPTGNVVFKIDNEVWETVALVNGVATSGVNGFADGKYLITAEYMGDTEYAASAAAFAELTVVRHATSVALTATPNPVVNGSSVAFEATVTSGSGTPTGDVVFNDGATALMTVSLSSGVATFSTADLALGTHGITAEYVGAVAHAPSTSALVAVDVVRLATTTALDVTPNAADYGDEVTLEATVSGTGTPTGLVSFWDGAVKLGEAELSGGKASITVDDLTAGSHGLTAMYAGSSTHVESTSTPVSIEIDQATTKITLESSGGNSSFAQTIYLSATVEVNVAAMQAAGLNANAETTPTGFVTFMDGNEIIGVVELEDGKAYLTIQTLRPGVHNITASYGANGNFTTSTSSVVVQTVALAQLGVALQANPNPAFAYQVVTLKAIVLAPEGNPTGSVTFMEGNQVLGVVELAGDTATLVLSNLQPGRHDIIAVYNGDGGFASQGSQPFPLTIKAYLPQLRMPVLYR